MNAHRAPTRLAIVTSKGVTAAAMLLVTFACGSSTERADSASSIEVACRAAKPFPVHFFEEPSFVFTNGAITTTPSGWLVAGVERDAAATGSIPVGERLGRPRILHEELGEVIVPAGSGASDTPDAPVPVALSNGGWGIVWAKAVPPESHIGNWPSDRFTQLWLTEWNDGEWVQPRLLVSANLGIDWPLGRTLRYVPGSGTFLMITKEDHVNDRHAMFGLVGDPLASIELGDAQPVTATFDVGEDERITALVQVYNVDESIGGDPQLRLFSLTSTNGGRSWNPAESLFNMKVGASSMRLHRDRRGTLHIVWTERLTEVRHMYMPADVSEWKQSSVRNREGSTLMLNGVSGIDQCGRLTIAREALSISGELWLRVERWEGDAWSPSADFDGFAAINIFDGVGSDGAWYLGWSGSERTPETDRAYRMALWLAKP